MARGHSSVERKTTECVQRVDRYAVIHKPVSNLSMVVLSRDVQRHASCQPIIDQAGQDTGSLDLPGLGVRAEVKQGKKLVKLASATGIKQSVALSLRCNLLLPV